MRVKKFVARTLPEAMGQVKAELGADAVILHTNEIKVGGVFGLFGSRMIQVMAAVEEKAVAEKPGPERAPVAGTMTGPLNAGGLRPPRAMPPAPASVPVPAPAPAPLAAASSPDAAVEVAAVREEMAGMKAMMGQLISRLDQPAAVSKLEPPLRELRAQLNRGGVADDVALSLIKRVRTRAAKGQGTPAELLELMQTLMVKDLGVAQKVTETGRIIALAGPTGVGKTTTLAKLAAHLALNQRKRIAMITADTYRIAAVDQLRTYSEILGVPLEVVYDPSEVPAALARHQDKDLILVDTAGRSPRNHVHMHELKTYLDVLEPAQTYLVLSMTSGYRDAAVTVDHYLPVGFDAFLFTKWDEASAPGLIYSMIAKYKRPLSYVTTGQNVPDDIEVADPEAITRAILGV